MKVGLIAASVVLVAGSATGCSSGASQEDFCDAYGDFTTALMNIESEDPKDYIKELKSAAEDFGDVGAAEDMSDDAKAGFELVLDAIDELDEDSSLEELGKMEDEFSDDEKKQSDAFEAYLNKNCDDAPELDEGGDN